MRLVLLLMLAAVGFGQTPAASTFWAVGVSAFPQSAPHPSGWAAIATPLNQKLQLFSISETDFFPVGVSPIKIQTSVRTGLATLVKQVGNVQVYGLADAGTATTGTSTGSAFAGGGAALVPVAKGKYTLVFGVRVLKTSTGGSSSVIELGFGRVNKP